MSASIVAVRKVIGSTATATKIGKLVYVTGYNVTHSADFRAILIEALREAGMTAGSELYGGPDSVSRPRIVVGY